MRTLAISVETSFCSLLFEGVKPPRARILDQSFWPIPRISAKTATDENPVLVRNFPLLFEDIDYRIVAQSKVPGEEVLLWHRDARLIDGIGAIEGVIPSTVAGTLRFWQRTGLSDFEVSVGDARMSVTVEVFPSKLDYLDDFEEMLADVQKLDRSLLLRYFGATYRQYRTSDSAEPIPLDWLAILRSEIDQLDQSLRYASAHPLMLLEGEERLESAHKLKSADSLTRNAIRRGAGTGSWLGVPSIGPNVSVRSQIPSVARVDTLDSPEHRWLKSQLSHVGLELGRLQELLIAERQRQAGRGQRLDEFLDSTSQEVAEVQGFAVVVNALSRLPIIAETSDAAVPSGFTSLRLLQSPGYREATRALLALRLALTAAEGIGQLSTVPIGTLYEAWCFVRVVELLDRITGSMCLDSLGHLVEEETLGRRLVKGRQTAIDFDLEDGRTMSLRYNPSYTGPTGLQIPDMEIRFTSRIHTDLIVLIDAKYRIDWTEEAFRFFRITPPPRDAINALHRYRDAITIWGSTGDGRQDFRPVVRGAALYPLSASASTSYATSELARAQDLLGIGAIPFLPGNTALVEAWLRDLIGKDPRELVWHGPPHPSLQVDMGFPSRSVRVDYRSTAE